MNDHRSVYWIQNSAYRLALLFSMSSSYWHIKEFDSKKIDVVAKEFKLPYSIAKIMSLRGIIDRKISSDFFYPDKNKLHSPYLLKDMDKAVNRILLQKKENI